MSKEPTISRKPVKRGAPKKVFALDADRYVIAVADAFQALGVSENDAFGLMAVRMLGEPVAEQNVGPRRKRGRGQIPGGTLVTFERAVGSGPAASFASKAATLRKKATAADGDPQAVLWRAAMSRCYVIALTATGDRERNAAIITELAGLVDEETHARDALQPLLAARLFWAARIITER